MLGILPDRVEMTCDFRHPVEANVVDMLERFRAEILALEAASNTSIIPLMCWL